MFITVTISCVLIVSGIIAWYFKRREKMSLFKRLGIPGPEPNLITGNLMAFFGTPNVEFYSQLINRYGPIVGYYLGSKPMIITKHLGLIKEIQRSRDFEDRPRLVPGGINPSSKRCKMLGNLPVNEWRELRKKLNTGFTTTQLRQMVPLVQQKIDKFIDKLSDKESFEIDFYKYYQRLTLDIIGRTAFGVDTDVQYNRNDRFLIAVKQEFVKTANNFLVKLLLCFPEFYYIIQGFRKLIEYVKETIRLTSTSLLWTDCETTLMMRKSGQRVADDGKDLLQIMIDKGLSDEYRSNYFVQ
ncbi:unnamed protein product [Medioppia subpectinata]|uniref:Cytochrome P450 n=1 Tax=Medioppia subpectinata TaxID=1979941 RepID=A0A7R9Q5Y2_9ACAR|nr:unnamed protein product [Medioppia subpectinata]CAG2113829.1 unnamed protein product [Medioppia subpectinata]